MSREAGLDDSASGSLQPQSLGDSVIKNSEPSPALTLTAPTLLLFGSLDIQILASAYKDNSHTLESLS